MTANECIKGRRSIRKFTDQPVSHELLVRIVETASYAPSWKHTQIVRYIAIEGETIMQNGSPFLVMDLQENMTNAPFMGQIIVTGQYGILRKEPEGIKLNHATFQGRSAKNG